MHKRIILGSFVAAGVLPLGIYFFNFYGPLSTEHHEWAEFGSYVSGAYGAFAFLILAYTTDLTRRQFQIQNQDNFFFKLHDSLEGRIASNTVVVGSTTHTAHQTFKVVAERFHEELSAVQTIEIARLLLCKTPEKIADLHFEKIFEATENRRSINSFTEYKASFITSINSQCDFNARWENLKFYIGSQGTESEKLRDALRATGSVNFYKIPFSDRCQHYSAVVQRISDDYGEFLDGYLKNICFLLEFATNAINRATYVDFLKAHFTQHELIILFYLVAGRDGKLGSMKNLRDLGIMDGLHTISRRSLIIDTPSNEEFKHEIENVFCDG